MSETPREFVEWFSKNYPKDTLIYDPAWHAPKIYRAATRQLERECAELRKALFEPLHMDAGYNLMGALNDIEHHPQHVADSICIDTIKRVLGQIAKARAALRAGSGEKP